MRQYRKRKRRKRANLHYFYIASIRRGWCVCAQLFDLALAAKRVTAKLLSHFFDCFLGPEKCQHTAGLLRDSASNRFPHQI